MKSRWWLSVASFVLVTMAGAARAHAQADPYGPLFLDVDFAFTVDGHALPAGHYQIEMAGPGAIVFRDVKGGHEAMAPAFTRLARSGSAPEDAARVVFDRVGDNYVASEVWFPDTDGFLVNVTKEGHTHHAVKLHPTT